MQGPKDISGEECIKILCNKFNFKIKRQRGSHVVLERIIENKKIITIVLVHHELKLGTLKGILKLAEVTEIEFSKYI